MEKDKGTSTVDQLSFRVPKVDLMTYRKFQVRVETHKIIEPSLSVRLLSEPLVNEVKGELSRNGYLSSVGMLSVALKKNDSWKASDIDQIQKKIFSGQELSEEVWLVDGRHRLTAMKQMMAAEAIWRESLAVLTVTLWGPPQGEFLSMSQLISLGCQLNRSSSTVRAHTFQDHVYSAVSFAASLRGSPQIMGSRGRLTSVNLAEALNQSGMLSHVDVRQRQRYAQVACRLSESKESLGMFLKQCESHPKLALVHISHDALLSNNSDAQLALGLRAVTSKVYNGIQGSFQDMRNAFYFFFNEVLDLLDNICQYEAVGFEQLLQKNVPITKHESCTVSQLVERSMGRFIAVEMQEVSNNRRMKALRKHLAKIVQVDNLAPREASTLRESAPKAESSTVHESPSKAKSPTMRRESASKAESASASRSESPTVSRQIASKAKIPTVLRERASIKESAIVAPVLRSNQDAALIRLPAAPSATEKEFLHGRQSALVRTPPERKRASKRPLPLSPRLPSPQVSKKLALGPSFQSPQVPQKLDLSPSFQSPQISKKLEHSTKRRVKSSSKHRRVSGRKKTESRKSPASSDDEYLEIEKATDEGSVIDAESIPFDDAIPELLPIGTQVPSTQHSEGADVAPERLVVALPSAWYAAKLQPQHVTKLLRAMFIPPEHRANLFVRDVKELEGNHAMIFVRAAFNYYMRHPHHLPEPWFGASGLKREVWRQVGYLSAQHTAVAMSYFGRAREELLQKGFCILEGFVADETVPDDEVTQMDANARSFFRKLHSAIEETFPGERALRAGKGKPHKSGWNQTAMSDHLASSESGTGRYTLSNAAMEVFEQDADRAWMARARALLDVRIGQAMAALGVCDNRDNGLEHLFTTKTGGRWLYTSRGCMREKLHTDFLLSDEGDDGISGRSTPGFFTMTTGPQEVPLWVCPFSHQIVSWNKDPASLERVSKGLKAIRVLIPPFSMMVGRGDMFHCGAGFDDYPGKSGLLRYHLYFVPESVSPSDGVYTMDEFQPTFQSDEHEEFRGSESRCGNGSEKSDPELVHEVDNDEEEWEQGGEQAHGLISLQPLSKKEKQTFKALLKSGRASENTDWQISREDLQQLDGCNYMGDNILNCMFDMINQRNRAHFSSHVPCSDESPLVGSIVLHEGPRPRLHVMNTQFLTRLRTQGRSKRYDYRGVRGAFSRAGLSIASFDTIAVPVFLTAIDHWTLVLVDFRRKKLFYIDSLYQGDHENVLKCIRRWVRDEVRDKGLLDASVQGVQKWECVINPPNAPRQEDHHACGIFVLYYIYFLELGIKPDFTQEDVQTLRVRTGLYIKEGEIPPSEYMTVE